MNKSKFIITLIVFVLGVFSFANFTTVQAQGRACCDARTGSPRCDYCSTAMTKTNISVPAGQGADFYGCGGITTSGFIQYDSNNVPVCRVCPLAYPYSIACTLPSPPITPPNPRCGGACTTTNDCPLVDGRVRSVCHPISKICVNPICPDSSELGSQCYCTLPTSSCGDKCGNWPEGKYPLCGDGKSTCAPTNGPSCTGLLNTYCQPITPGGGYTRPICSADTSYRYLQRPNGTVGNTQADVLAACATCSATYPGTPLLYYPAMNSTVTATGATTNVTANIDVSSTGWGSGCPANINTWTLSYKVNSGAFQTISSLTMPNLPVGSTVDWYVTKYNGSFSVSSIVYRFMVIAACIPTPPAAATLTSPADNSTAGLLPGNSVNVSYTLNGWGTSCVGTPITVLQVSRGCTGFFTANPSPTIISGLSINDNICWRVYKGNGSLGTTSAMWRFTVKSDEKTWMLGYNSNVSAAGGMVEFNVPSATASLSATLNDRNNNPILSDLNSTYTSTYGLISGNVQIPADRQSKQRQYITNYEDLSIAPPANSEYSNWYDYIYNLVSLNNGGNFTTYGSNATLSTTSSALASTAPNTKKHVLINGNLTVDSSTKCDSQTIFFVTGSVNLTPDFTNSSNSNACMFVSRQDVTVVAGNRASPALTTDNATLARYDYIEGAFITDSNLIVPKDIQNTSEKGDGLIIKGSVVSRDVILQRDMNLNANQLQPAHVFYFDPRYREVFKSDLNTNTYSIREVGYIAE